MSGFQGIKLLRSARAGGPKGTRTGRASELHCHIDVEIRSRLNDYCNRTGSQLGVAVSEGLRRLLAEQDVAADLAKIRTMLERAGLGGPQK